MERICDRMISEWFTSKIRSISMPNFVPIPTAKMLRFVEKFRAPTIDRLLHFANDSIEAFCWSTSGERMLCTTSNDDFVVLTRNFFTRRVHSEMQRLVFHFLPRRSRPHGLYGVGQFNYSSILYANFTFGLQRTNDEMQ